MNVNRLQPYFLLGLLAASGLLVFFIFKPFLVPLALAAIFAVVLKPVYQYLLRYMSGWPAAASLGTILFGIVCLVIPLSFLVFKIVGEAQQLAVSLSDGSGLAYVQTVVAYVQRLLEHYIPEAGQSSAVLTSSVNSYAKEVLSWVVSNFGTLFSSVAHTLFSFFIFLIALFYLLRDGEKLRDLLVRLSPLADKDDRTVFDQLERAVDSVVKGNLTVALIQGVLSGIGLTLFGVPNPILWGVVAGVAALVPGFGTSLVLLPAIAFLLITGALWPAAGLLLWAAFAVGLIDNFIGPRLVGRRARLHPLMVLLSVLGGVVLFGPAGLFLGPLCASFLLALLAIYSESAST